MFASEKRLLSLIALKPQAVVINHQLSFVHKMSLQTYTIPSNANETHRKFSFERTDGVLCFVYK